MRMKCIAWLVFSCAVVSVVHGDVLRVFVGIGPQLESVRRIGGEQVEVESLVPAGASPETYSASPRKMSSLARADMYIGIGAPFERSLKEKIRQSFPELTVVDGTHGMTFRRMDEGGICGHGHHHGHGHGHSHGHGHGHAAGDDDPHVWLCIGNMQVHARNVAAALSAALPEHAGEFSRRLAAYLEELSALDQEMARMLAPYAGGEVVVFHPAFGYYLERYGLHQHAVELGGKEPGGRHLGALIRQARKAGTRSIYVQPQFNSKASEVLAREIGGSVLRLEPLPEAYSEGMRAICAQLLKGFASNIVQE